MRRRAIAAAAWALAGAALAGGALAAEAGPLGQYLGNTFVSHHQDGVEYRVLYAADHTFALSRKGGPDRAADFQARGTYTVDPTGKVCFAFRPSAPRFPACVVQDVTRRVGESWDFKLTPTSEVERHSLVKGRQFP
jgi:hypothetical protein